MIGEGEDHQVVRRSAAGKSLGDIARGRLWLAGGERWLIGLAAAQAIGVELVGIGVGQVIPAQIGDAQLAEHIVQDRGGRAHGVVAGHRPRWLEPGEDEGLDELVQGHAVLQADGDGDGEVVHQRSEGRAFLVHVDEDLAELAFVILAGVQIDLVAADRGLLDIAFAAVRQLAALALALHHPLDDPLFRRGRRGGRRRPGAKRFSPGRFSHRRQVERLIGRRLGALDAHGADPGVSRMGHQGLNVVQAGVPGEGEFGQSRLRQGRLDVRQQGEIGPWPQVIGGKEDRLLGGVQVWPLQAVGAQGVGLGCRDLGLGEAHDAQGVEPRIVQVLARRPQDVGQEALANHLGAEGLAQGQAIGQGGLDRADLVLGEAAGRQGGVVYPWRMLQAAVTEQAPAGGVQVGADGLQAAEGGFTHHPNDVAIGGFGEGDGAFPGLASRAGPAEHQGELRIIEHARSAVQGGAGGMGRQACALEQVAGGLPALVGIIGQALGGQPFGQTRQAQHGGFPLGQAGQGRGQQSHRRLEAADIEVFAAAERHQIDATQGVGRRRRRLEGDGQAAGFPGGKGQRTVHGRDRL